MEESATGDFLKKAARTPLRGHHLMAGVHLRIETNFEPILRVARETFEEVPAVHEGVKEVRLRFWVEDARHAGATRTKPYFRGLDHLVFAGFDGRNSLLINLRDRYGLGRFTYEVASDANFWKTTIFPVLLTVLGPSVGLTLLHCACVAWKGSGLLLAGESGSGKSTLSLALAQAGFDFLSDDRTLAGEYQGRLLAWGLSAEMKQIAGAVAYFPALHRVKPDNHLNRQGALRFDPVKIFGISHVRCCEPRWVVFLERQPSPAFYLTSVPPDEAARRLESHLHRESPEVRETQCRTVETLVTRECYQLRYGGDPHMIAGALRTLVTEGWKAGKSLPRTSPRKQLQPEAHCEDPLRRFRATPLACQVLLMGRSIRVETNSRPVMKQVEHLMNRFASPVSLDSQFLWKIVAEPGEEVAVSWPAMTAFSDNDVRYINLGQRSFIAVDLRARQAVGVLPEHFASDEPGFSSVFLASMFYLTAPALGLVAVSAACVAVEGRGLLLFGTPGSGKTTASYRSTRLGLDFHADQAVFLEVKTGKLCAWGDFWPAAFRPDTAEIFPELASQLRSLVYCDRTFLCIPKNPSNASAARSTIPVGCIFLEREAGTSPKLVPLRQGETSARLAAFVPFKDDAGSLSERDWTFKALSRLPAYRLAYGNDSSEVAVFLRSILSTHRPMEEPS